MLGGRNAASKPAAQFVPMACAARSLARADGLWVTAAAAVKVIAGR